VQLDSVHVGTIWVLYGYYTGWLTPVASPTRDVVGSSKDGDINQVLRKKDRRIIDTSILKHTMTYSTIFHRQNVSKRSRDELKPQNGLYSIINYIRQPAVHCCAAKMHTRRRRKIRQCHDERKFQGSRPTIYDYLYTTDVRSADVDVTSRKTAD